MNLDPSYLFTSLMLGLVGTALFVYGKRQGRIVELAAGLVIALVPLFVSNVLLMLLIALAIGGALVLVWRAGV